MFTKFRLTSRGENLNVSKRFGPPLAAPESYTRHHRRDVASGPDDDVSRHAVLVFSSDPLAAALLGAAIELTGHEPHFPQANESARNALLRVRPRLAVIDCDHEEACSDAFIGPALMTGSRVLLFHSHRTRRPIGDLADRRDLTVMEMPAEQETLTKILQGLLK
jgi:hypothetical protein